MDCLQFGTQGAVNLRSRIGPNLAPRSDTDMLDHRQAHHRNTGCRRKPSPNTSTWSGLIRTSNLGLHCWGMDMSCSMFAQTHGSTDFHCTFGHRYKDNPRDQQRGPVRAPVTQQSRTDPSLALHWGMGRSGHHLVHRRNTGCQRKLSPSTSTRSRLIRTSDLGLHCWGMDMSYSMFAQTHGNTELHCTSDHPCRDNPHVPLWNASIRMCAHSHTGPNLALHWGRDRSVHRQAHHRNTGCPRKPSPSTSTWSGLIRTSNLGLHCWG